MRNVLYLYNASQTYTNTVYEYLASFAAYAKHRVSYCHLDEFTDFGIDLSQFDVVVLHYSVRLPLDQISASAAQALAGFRGLKALFIQDEYDHTRKAWDWIGRLGVQLVFTVVPEAGIKRVYPPDRFPNTRFVSILTGYAPEELDAKSTSLPPSQRPLVIGYRGRPLSIRYGQMALDKVRIGEMVKGYCDKHRIQTDIAWSEESRIYGPRWYRFIRSCRATLGVESGSNVFDWDGTLDAKLAEFRRQHPGVSDRTVYETVIKPQEIEGLMNQVSPRVFESISARSVLVMFEGGYSGVLQPGEHFIALRKDGSNLTEVIQLLHDAAYVDHMAERAFQHVIASGSYAYRKFVELIDAQFQQSLDAMQWSPSIAVLTEPVGRASALMTAHPVRANPPEVSSYAVAHTMKLAAYAWRMLPAFVRSRLKGPVHRLLGRV